MNKRKRILVTGGNGYVGREVARLSSSEHDVCIVDNLRNGKLRFSPDELAFLRFAKCDITDGGAVAAVVEDFQPDAIIHLAAVHYIPECDKDPALAVDTNVVGTLNMLLACPANCRFVYASSGAVYKPDAHPHSEKSAREPSDIYGLSKLHSEAYVEYLTKRRQLSAVVVRLFNVVGPGETTPHLVPEIVAQLKAGRTKVGLGNLSPKRDYIHVLDAARGFIATALNGEVQPGTVVTVNLGTSKAFSVQEVIEKLRLVTQIDFRCEQEGGRTRPVDRPFLAADNQEIRRRFDWVPSLTIDDALADLWRKPDLADALMDRYR